MATKPNRVTPPTTRPTAPRPTTPAEAADKVSLNPKGPHRPTPSEEEIRARAYFLWEQAGCPEGDGLRFWLEAEKELSNPR